MLTAFICLVYDIEKLALVQEAQRRLAGAREGMTAGMVEEGVDW